MTAIDPAELRIFVYDRILADGFPPTVAEIAATHGVAVDVARDSLGRLDIGKTILTDKRSGEIRMAGPFAATRTDYRVESGRRVWWANCAWDAFGIGMLVNDSVRIFAKCRDCGESIEASCNPSAPPVDEHAVVHFLLPAGRWYDDIGYT